MRKYLILSILVISTLCSGCGNNKIDTTKTSLQDNNAKWLIAAHEHGENYPYTEYYLTINCKKSAVWLENNAGEKYALNGIAKSMLKDDKNYRGGTDLILKKGKKDLYLPAEAMQYCLRLD